MGRTGGAGILVRAVLLLALAARWLAFAPAQSSGAAAGQAAPRCFPGFTQHCVDGLFRQQWEARGGLALNGYPLTAEFDELLDVPGIGPQSFRVQYFERVRLELHPDPLTGLPLVLLGQFGRAIRPADPPVPALPGATYFARTGHNVTRQAFIDYWLANGAVPQ